MLMIEPAAEDVEGGTGAPVQPPAVPRRFLPMNQAAFIRWLTAQRKFTLAGPMA